MTTRSPRRLIALTLAWVVAGAAVPVAITSAGTRPKCFGKAATKVGTKGSEVIRGTNRRDVIVARGGDDSILAQGGDDLVCGGAGSDEIIGADGADKATGQAGMDALVGGPGNDRLDTGPGVLEYLAGGSGDDRLFGRTALDIADFGTAKRPVRVDLGAGTAAGEGKDVLKGIEIVGGSRFADTMTGDDDLNVLIGFGGGDTLDGGGNPAGLESPRDIAFADQLTGDGAGSRQAPGDDTLIGGAGTTFALYFSAPQGIQADLATGAVSGEGDDTLQDVQGIVGSSFDDALSGGLGDEAFEGGPGDDDIDGGEGRDVLLYVDSELGVDVDLGTGTATGDGSDAFGGIEAVFGSAVADDLVGDDGANELRGFDGDDVLTGLGGDDTLAGEAGRDSADGGEGNDACAAESESNCETDAAATRAWLFRLGGSKGLMPRVLGLIRAARR